ncbi:hypothetical protein [Devosia sp. A16]|uniref:hypothetical protein n=1 Tax=Devosia sp. A16 TaxID=1736675 RepID=UPI0006D7E4FF|nr:hypothetical protein [Devosia sp. A16]
MTGIDGQSVPEARTIYISGGWLAGAFAASALVGLVGGVQLFRAELLFGGLWLALSCAGLWWVLGGTLTSRTPLIAMDLVGIFDRRVTRRLIRWVDILSVQPVRARGRVRGALLVLRPEILNGLPLSPLSRLLLLIRKWTWHEGLAIMAWGTQVDGEQLYNWCLAYSRAHKFEVDKEHV